MNSILSGFFCFLFGRTWSNRSSWSCRFLVCKTKSLYLLEKLNPRSLLGGGYSFYFSYDSSIYIPLSFLTFLCMSVKLLYCSASDPYTLFFLSNIVVSVIFSKSFYMISRFFSTMNFWASISGSFFLPPLIYASIELGNIEFSYNPGAYISPF